MSEKARRRVPDRVAAMKIVKQRDQVCQFWPRLMSWGEQMEVSPLVPVEVAMEFIYTFDLRLLPDCWGELEGHEPEKRSHCADPTDPEQIVLLCHLHNGWVEDYPLAAKALRL
jgi:hypothetical protein